MKGWTLKKSDMDLLVGTSILIAVIILIAGVLWLKEVSVSRKMVDYAVVFPNVGTLQVGDPVMINGVSKGAVKKISLRSTEVAVILEMDKSVPITDSCRIMIQNIGLMGERGVGIQYAEHGTVILPISENADTVFLRGTFDTGIAEAMGMLGSVLGEVQELTSNLTAVVNQTIGDTSFVTLFKSLSGRLDTIATVIEKMVVENKEPLEQSLKNVEILSSEARKLLERNTPSIDSMVANGEALTSKALVIATSIDSMSVTLKSVLARIDDEETTAGKLLRDKALYGDLKKTVADLDTLVKNVQEDALKLRIRIEFGKKKK